MESHVSRLITRLQSLNAVFLAPVLLLIPSIRTSAAIFGIARLIYSLAYAACAFLAGLALTTGYVARMRPGGQPFLLVFLVHAASNALALAGRYA